MIGKLKNIYFHVLYDKLSHSMLEQEHQNIPSME